MRECYYSNCRLHPQDEPFCCELTCTKTFFKVWADGTISKEALGYMSDDYVVIPADSEEEALEIFANKHGRTNRRTT